MADMTIEEPHQERTVPAVTRMFPALQAAFTDLVIPGGLLPPPTMHLFLDNIQEPYVGYISARPYSRGPDAHEAIAQLGRFPSVLAANRVLLTWEDQDLTVSLHGAADDTPTAWSTLEATFSQHTLTRTPLTLTIRGVQVEHIDWGQPTTTVDGPLPAPVTEAIERWRQLDLDADADLQHTVTELQTAGYRIHFAARDSI